MKKDFKNWFDQEKRIFSGCFLAVIILGFFTIWAFSLFGKAMNKAYIEKGLKYEEDAKVCRDKGGVPIKRILENSLSNCIFDK